MSTTTYALGLLLAAGSVVAAAEAQGAPSAGWTAHIPGAALPLAADVAWRIQPLPLGGAT